MTDMTDIGIAGRVVKDTDTDIRHPEMITRKVPTTLITTTITITVAVVQSQKETKIRGYHL